MSSLHGKMARRLNSIALCVIIGLCILLIYASNRISSPPFASAPPDEYIRSMKMQHHREYHHQTYQNRNFNELDNNRHSAKYNQLMHPHNTEQRNQYYSRRFGNRNSDIETAETMNYINMSIRIEDVIDGQRQRIASKMRDFEYTEQMIGLNALTPETNGQPIQSIIFSTWRSGSTFLGDILNAMPANYYHYEPLIYYEIQQIREPPMSDVALNALRQLLKCNYTSLNEYLNYAQSHNNVFSHNIRLWRICETHPQFCYEPKFLSAFCRLFPFQSMKVVRLRAALAESLLIDSSLNVKIILLARDPRGTVQSRKHRDWCPGVPDCDNPAILCKDMVSDYKAAKILLKKYPTRFKVVRYEDLSLEPFKLTKEILTFYGLPFDPDVEDFLDSHTRADIGGVSSTFRDSKTAPFHWMRDLAFDEINYIQQQCTKAMNLWGYRKADNEDMLLTNIFNPMLPYSFGTHNETIKT